MGQSLAARIVSILFYVLFAVSIVLGVLFFINKEGYTDTLLIWSAILALGAIGVTFLFTLANMFKTKKTMLSSLLVIGIFAVLIGVSYAMSSGEVLYNAAGEAFDETEQVFRWTGASLHLLYILLGASFLSLIFTEIRGAFK